MPLEKFKKNFVYTVAMNQVVKINKDVDVQSLIKNIKLDKKEMKDLKNHSWKSRKCSQKI